MAKKTDKNADSKTAPEKTVQDAIDKELAKKPDVDLKGFEKISSQILRFNEPGEWFMGVYEGSEEFKGDYDVPCQIHKFVDLETDARVSCVLGKMADTFIEEAGVKPGDTLYIRYLSQSLTRKNNKVNNYDIRIKRG